MDILTPAALLPPYEAERLRSLHHYNLQATPADGIFHSLVALAAHAFAQPMAFLALVEEHEVSFPVQHGLGAMPPLPRAHALCSSAVLCPHAVAYENIPTAAQTGPDAPAIRAAVALGLGFYAAAPLRMPDGQPIGVLCLAGPEPRAFQAAEETALESLADVTSLALAVHHLCRSTPELGPVQWANLCDRLQHDVDTLEEQLAELRHKHAPAGAAVPDEVLNALTQGLQALHLELLD